MIAAEVRRSLRRRADNLGIDFQQALQYYAIERFLFRLSQTAAADRLIVKGATLLRVWDVPTARPTRDIDFTGRISNSPEAVKSVVRECLQVAVSDDGLEFEREISAEPIALGDRYPGVRVAIRGHLGGARFVLRLDIGVDDAVVPEPGWVDYPTLLGGPGPRILAYQPSTVVAEKYEAMISLGLANSRLKDYYDLWILAATMSFDGRELGDALRATFAKRESVLTLETPAGLTADFYDQASTQAMWQTFVRKLAVSGIAAPADLAEVVEAIAAFVLPVALAAAEGQPVVAMWTADEGWQPLS